MLVSIIEGILIAICLKLVGLPYAVTIGAAVCVLGIIPYLGIISAFIPAVLLAWFTWGDFQHILIVSGIFLAVNQFDGWVIQPKIVGDSVELHPQMCIRDSSRNMSIKNLHMAARSLSICLPASVSTSTFGISGDCLLYTSRCV